MSRDLNGANGVLNIPAVSVLRPSLPVTIAAWIYPESLNTEGIFHNNKTTTQHRGIWFAIDTVTGDFSANYGDNGGGAASDRRSKLATAAIVADSWQHVATRIRGATDMDLLVNGTDVGGTYSGTGGALAYAVASGQIGSVTGGNFFDGSLAEVAFWSISLTDPEVQQLVDGVCPMLVQWPFMLGYWPLRGVDSPEPDLSRNYNNASIAGEALGAPHPPNVGCDNTATPSPARLGGVSPW